MKIRVYKFMFVEVWTTETWDPITSPQVVSMYVFSNGNLIPTQISRENSPEKQTMLINLDGVKYCPRFPSPYSVRASTHDPIRLRIRHRGIMIIYLWVDSHVDKSRTKTTYKPVANYIFKLYLISGDLARISGRNINSLLWF